MFLKLVDKLVFELKRVVYIVVFLLIITAFLMFVYWVGVNMKFSMPQLFSDFVTSTTHIFTDFLKPFSIYRDIIQVLPVTASIIIGLLAYLLNCFCDILDMLHDSYKKNWLNKKLKLERKINKELHKNFLKELESYSLMLVKINIVAEFLSSYLTAHIDGVVDTEELSKKISSEILQSVSTSNIIQKGVRGKCIYFLLSDLANSKLFFNSLVDSTTEIVSRYLSNKIKIKFYCAVDVMNYINELPHKEVVTDKIINFAIPNSIIVTPAVKTYYENLYKDLFKFSISGEFNLSSNNDSAEPTNLYSMKRK